MPTTFGPYVSSAPATLRPDLAGTFTEWDLAGNLAELNGTKALPVIDVAQASGIFPKIQIEELAKLGDVDRAPGSGYKRGSFKTTSDTYTTEEAGREEVVDEKLAKIYKNFVDAEMIAAARARNIVMTQWERTLAALLFNSSTWTPSGVSTEWSTFATAKPINDIETAKQTIRTNTGMEANAVIFSRKVYRNLRQCTQIIEALQAAGAGVQALLGSITQAKLAEVFDVKHVIVVGGAYDSAREGAATTMADVWDDEYCMVARVAETNDISEPCVGRTFHWGEDGSMPNGIFEEYDEPQTRSKVIRFRRHTGAKILYTELAVLLGNITA